MVRYARHARASGLPKAEYPGFWAAGTVAFGGHKPRYLPRMGDVSRARRTVLFPGQLPAAAAGNAAAGWIWRTGDAKPVAAKGLAMRTESSIVDGKETEAHVISAADRSFTIAGGEALYRYSFVDELGAFTGYLVKVAIGKPVTTYFDARVHSGTENLRCRACWN